MAVTNKYSEQFILELYRKEHDVESDSLVACLMNDSFVFNPATHATYSDIQASELTTGGGYTVKTKALTTVAASIVSNEVIIDCDNISWTATTGGIPSTAAVCIVNTSHLNETVVCCLEYGAAYATSDGNIFQVNYANGLMKGVPNPSAA